jgi:hypothetical protein
VGKKPLTWQQVLIVLLCIVLFVGLILAFGANIDPPQRRTGGYILAVTITLIVALAVWHVRANNRPDIQPDILAQIVDKRAILQAGSGAHVWLSTTQEQGVLIILCLFQNLIDAETHVEIDLQPDQGGKFVGFVPVLSAILNPSQVGRASICVPLRPVDQPSTLRFVIRATSRAQKGERVRFARRTAVTKRVSPALTGALLLAGHYHGGGGTFLNVALQPFSPTAPLPRPAPREWELASLWNVGEPADGRRLAALLGA